MGPVQTPVRTHLATQRRWSADGHLSLGVQRLHDTYLGENYNNAATLHAAAGVAVTAGATTANINASLAFPVTSREGPRIRRFRDRGRGRHGVLASGRVSGRLQGCLHECRWQLRRERPADRHVPVGVLGRVRLLPGRVLQQRRHARSRHRRRGDRRLDHHQHQRELASAGHITGKVTNPGGTGISDIDVTAYSLRNGVWEVTTRPSPLDYGTYSLGGLPTGTYRVEFLDYTARTRSNTTTTRQRSTP